MNDNQSYTPHKLLESVGVTFVAEWLRRKGYFVEVSAGALAQKVPDLYYAPSGSSLELLAELPDDLLKEELRRRNSSA